MNVRAGALRLELEGADIRYVRFGGLELVRRIYAAVRDEAWGTVPYERTLLALDRGADRFRARFACSARTSAIALDWVIDVEGTASRQIHYRMEGEAGADFAFNRLGICVLHPPAAAAGHSYRAALGGVASEGRLPLRIGPQPVENGIAVALFEPFQELEISLPPDGRLRFAFAGDEFEMEDQRNWTDSSFKTYSTPLARGLPHHASAGERFAQAVDVSFVPPSKPPPGRPRAVSVALGEAGEARLPAIGVAQPDATLALAPQESERLSAMHLSHLRCTLDGTAAVVEEQLAPALEAATRLRAQLEIVLVVGEHGEDELNSLARALSPLREILARVMVFNRDGTATSAALASVARAELGAATPGVALVTGTSGNFVELNRARPDLGWLDAVAYSVDPQVHAFDDRSLVETLEAQTETVRSARALSHGLPVVVGPVTLGPRRSDSVDPRHDALFGAAWTAGSLHRLAAAGVESVTYFATTGPGGVVTPERVRPLYHVLRDVGEWRAARVVPVELSDPLAVEALAVESEHGIAMLVASLRPRAARVRLPSLPGRRVALRMLAADSCERACTAPEAFRSDWQHFQVDAHGLAVDLPAFATARVQLR